MAKASKTAAKRIGRPTGRKPLLNLRIEQKLLDQLKAAAEQEKRVISEEVIRRLDRSFEVEDLITDTLGGPALRNHALSMLGRFAAAGQEAAQGRPAQEWLRDPECYRAAVVAVAASLIEPMKGPNEKAVTLHDLHSRLERQLLKSGHLKFDFGDGPIGSGFIAPKGDDK